MNCPCTVSSLPGRRYVPWWRRPTCRGRSNRTVCCRSLASPRTNMKQLIRGNPCSRTVKKVHDFYGISFIIQMKVIYKIRLSPLLFSDKRILLAFSRERTFEDQHVHKAHASILSEISTLSHNERRTIICALITGVVLLCAMTIMEICSVWGILKDRGYPVRPLRLLRTLSAQAWRTAPLRK